VRGKGDQGKKRRRRRRRKIGMLEWVPLMKMKR